MAPNVRFTSKKLGYPLYGADFDPLNSDFLLVGGGGGSTSSGVPNKISLLDTSRREGLFEIADIELAKNEDSVTTLGIAESSNSSLTAFAGINSSATDLDAGKNEHLRSFRVGLPAKKTGETEEKPSSVSTKALSRTGLFKTIKGQKTEAYQRVLRFSRIQKAGEPRVGVVASGLAKENEVIAFSCDPSTGSTTIISQLKVGASEAADADVMHSEEDGFLMAYCMDEIVFVQRLGDLKTQEPSKPAVVYESLYRTLNRAPNKRAKFRAVRFIGPRHLAVLQNRPNRDGVEILVVKLSKDLTQGQSGFYKRLDKKIATAVGMDVSILPAAVDTGETQIVIAVAAQNSSIQLLTIDRIPDRAIESCHVYTTLQNVHNGPITRTVFSNYIGPALPVTKDTKPQSLRLASVGVDQTAVVHTLPLHPFPASSSKHPRYVLRSPGRTERQQNILGIITGSLVVLVLAFIIQVLCEIRGYSAPALGAPKWLSPSLQERWVVPYDFYKAHPMVYNPKTLSEDMSRAASSLSLRASSTLSSVTSVVTDAVQAPLVDLQNQLENSDLKTPQKIVVRDMGAGEDVSAEIHHDAQVIKDKALKQWDDLSDKQKKGWKKKLMDAGHWAESQGEAVLKGILFSELAGAVGRL